MKKIGRHLIFPHGTYIPVLLATDVTYYDLQEIRFKPDIAVFKGDNELNEVLGFYRVTRFFF
ncbi:MAG: hypothetical protein MZV63_28920 [Marinilabiliales bacterium]|nr:hypothetical protein [Marinilabiliales bacterium]